jgi:hypothetical protein
MVGLSIMKSTIFVATLLSLTSLAGYTNNTAVIDILKKINEDNRNTRIKEGFKPDGGVSVVQVSQINTSEKQKSIWEKERREQNEKGYISMYSDRAKELLQLEDIVKFKYKASENVLNPNSSAFRKNISEIVMAYEYKPIPPKYVNKLFGFAACNTFKEGWTGVVEFFKNNQIGVCAFTENNVRLTFQAAKVDANIASYEVNNKVTVITVEGSKDSGYLYKVDWFDDNFFRSLECAANHYSNKELEAVLNLAKKIDS